MAYTHLKQQSSGVEAAVPDLFRLEHPGCLPQNLQKELHGRLRLIIDDHEASLHQQMDENGKDLFSG